MTTSRVVLAVMAIVVVSACGGSYSTPSGPSPSPTPSVTPAPAPSPVPTPTPIPSPTPTPSGSGLVFNISAGVSPGDESAIRTGLDLAQTFFKSTFGRPVEGVIAVQITTSSGQAPAFASSDGITFNTAHPVWTSTAAINKQKISVHELFHVFQFRNGFSSNPAWFIEGGAEYIGYQAIASIGLLDFQTAKRCQIYSLRNSTVPVPTLRDGGIPSTGGYWLAFLAIDYMAGGRLATFASIINQPSPSWDGKMTPVTGLSADRFYDSFEAARQQLPTPTNYECPR